MTKRTTVPRPDAERVKWHQESLFEPDVYHVTLTVGVVLSTDHVQVQVEARDPETNQIRGMVSWPHRRTAKMVDTMQEAFTELLGFLPTF